MSAVLRRFGYKNVADELHGSNVHRLENGMTLGSTPREIW